MNVNKSNYQDFLAKHDITDTQIDRLIEICSYAGVTYDKHSMIKFLNEFSDKLKHGKS